MCNCVILHYNLLLCSASFCWGVTALLKFHQHVVPMTIFSPSTFLVGAILHPVGNLHKICKHAHIAHAHIVHAHIAHNKQIQFQHYHISRPLQGDMIWQFPKIKNGFPQKESSFPEREKKMISWESKRGFPKKWNVDFPRQKKIDFPREREN